MKISIKTLKGSSFEIEVEPSSTVADIKKLIETTQGQNVCPADGQVHLLIHGGKVLKDETTLEENRVLENDFIVTMVCKVSFMVTEHVGESLNFCVDLL